MPDIEYGPACIEHTKYHRKDGYGVITKHGKKKLLHRDVLEDFMGLNLPKAALVRHGCDNPKCVNPTHLVMGTAKQNQQDRIRHGTYQFGTKNRQAKLTKTQADEIRVRRLNGEKGVNLAKEFKISPQSVCDIHKGRTIYAE